MSVNPSVEEGGAARLFGRTKYLQTNTAGGGTCLWAPEGERGLGTKHITENGVYQANKDGEYGWSHVTVNVSQATSVTGKDPTTGKERTVSVDPGTGDLVSNPTPVEIRVIVPPDNPYGIYTDGQTIGKSGMVVKAYDEDGNELLTVPVGEITLNPTTAVYDESKDDGLIGQATYNGITFPVYSEFKAEFTDAEIESWSDSGYQGIGFTSGSGVATAYINNEGHQITMIASKDKVITCDTIVMLWSHPEGNLVVQYEYRDTTHNGNAHTYNGKTVYVTYPGSRTDWKYNWQTIDVPDSYTSMAAWTLIYGDVEATTPGASQTITVSWPRTGDGAVLETTFDIRVAPPGGGHGED